MSNSDDDSSIQKALAESNFQLSLLDGDNSEFATMKRIAILNAQADLLYCLRDAAKAEGRNTLASHFDDAATEAWGGVMEAAHDLEAAPRNKLLRDFNSEHPDLVNLLAASLNSTEP